MNSQTASEEIKGTTERPLISSWLTLAWILTPVWSAVLYGSVIALVNHLVYSQTGSKLYSFLSKEQLMLGWFGLMGLVWIGVLLRHPRSVHFFLPVFWFMLGYVSLSVGLRFESTFQACAGRSIHSFEYRP